MRLESRLFFDSDSICQVPQNAEREHKQVDRVIFPSNYSDANLPSELLILNRYCIKFADLKAAQRASQLYGISHLEALTAAGILSERTWVEAQALLSAERSRARRNHKIRTWLLDKAVNSLQRTSPQYSAYRTFSGHQLLAFFFPTAAAIYYMLSDAGGVLKIIVLALTLFYAISIVSRGMLLAKFDESLAVRKSEMNFDDDSLPIYTILVALYKEPNQVNDLAQYLWNLDWPKGKLDIKLICEADDLETIAAIHDLELPPAFQVILVPPATPRTKPRALNYALPMAFGKYLVLYDAEDRPSSKQLREAYERFATGGTKLACLQAPLRIHNHDETWISRMFAIEYLTLFNGILPVLANWKLPLPLGGTSNHFKVDVLRQVGAWDPYNVTEDADLGIRLYREGYATETLTSPTYEEAPTELLPWLRQRTRWIKGWMQTILVHNRNPVLLFGDMGLRNGIAFHLFFTSVVLSVIIHPIFAGILIHQLWNLSVVQHDLDLFLLGTGIFNLVGGYTTYGLLALVVLKATGNNQFSGSVLTLPAYWMLISISGWRALLHLVVKPHNWEKTPHGLSKQKFRHSSN
ncbi:MAG: glycosyltransferase family 2 protein [Pseudomonadota bacterium]